MRVRIIGVPPGEAPEEIRVCWVGLALPLLVGIAAPCRVYAHGVLSGPTTWLEHWWRVLTGRSRRRMQYIVPFRQAMRILEKESPEAARWWRENTPQLDGPSGCLGFDPAVCEEIP